MKERPDWIKCVRSEKNPKRSLCDRSVVMEFCFMDVEHAVENEKNEGRLVTCPDCEALFPKEEESV